jgi:DNA-binding XRE family transcriptional regulator
MLGFFIRTGHLDAPRLLIYKNAIFRPLIYRWHFYNIAIMKTDINIAFGKRVAELRKAAGYSQEQFAYKCEMDRTYIGTIERGEKSPTLNTINKISSTLGITLNELFNFYY